MENIFLQITNQIPELPVFENNQVLTAGQLNDAIAFLDQQERASRNRLLGAGIACGLDITYSTGTITVSLGCGLTSAGDLIILDKSTSYSKVKKFTDEDGLYPLFKKPGQNDVIDLFELVNDGKNTTAVSDFFTGDIIPNDYVTVAYLENYIKDADICSADNCDNEGKRIIARLRFLLISKTDLNSIRQSFPSCTNDYFDLPDVNIVRPKLTGFTSFNQLSAAYTKAIDDSISGIDNALNKAEEVYAGITKDASSAISSLLKTNFEEIFSFTGIKGIISTGPVKAASFSSIVKALKDSFNTKPGIQYVYDFVKDVCEAYMEFKESAYEICTCCLPDTGKFPKHLMLGELIPPVNQPLSYRHNFCKSPILDGNHNLSGIMNYYYHRLETIKNNFIFKVNTAESIKITPTKNFESPIGDRAIPYYYAIDKILPVWNYEKSAKFKQASNLSYQSTANILNSNLDKFSYFRVEGHIGKNFKSVLKLLDSQIKSSNLPIDIIALKLDSQFSDTDIQYTCNFEDLESQYRSIRALLICKNEDYKNYFNSVKTQAQVVGDVATVVKKSTKKSSRGGGNPVISNAGLKENLANFTQPMVFTNTNASPTISAAELEQSIQLVNEITIAGVYDFGKYLTGITFLLNSIPNFNLPDSLATLDLDTVKTIFDGYTTFAAGFKKELAADTKQYSYFTQEEMLNYLYDMQDSCHYDQLEALKSEYDNRINDIKKQNLFSEYIAKNPGLDHNCGVPKGGTFVIVYQEQFRKTTPFFPLTEFVSPLLTINTEMGASGATTKKKAEKSGIANTGFDTGKTTVQSPEFFNNVFTKLDELNLSKEALDLIKLPIIDKYFPFDPIQTIQVADYTVVADFYLPYRCCSDCAPVAYVFPEIPEPKPEEEKISLKLQKNKFCDDDKTEYQIEFTPTGGTMEGNGVTSNASGFIFAPAIAGLGTHSIGYKLASGQSASISVEVTEHAEAAFTISETSETDTSTIIKLKNTSLHATQYAWNFGNGLTSADEHPEIEYKKLTTDQTFTITLVASNDVCSSQAFLEVTIKAQQLNENILFSIDKKDFAFDDKTNYKFNISPAPKTTDEILNPDNLNLGLSGEVLSFVPAKQKLTSTKLFHLSYGKDVNAASVDVNIVVPDASFKIKLQAGRGAIGGAAGFANSTVVFTSNVKKAAAYEWNLVVNNVKITTENAQEISSVFKEPKSATISLTITISVDGVNSSRTSSTIDLMKLDDATVKSLISGNEIDTKKIKQ